MDVRSLGADSRRMHAEGGGRGGVSEGGVTEKGGGHTKLLVDLRGLDPMISLIFSAPPSKDASSTHLPHRQSTGPRS